MLESLEAFQILEPENFLRKFTSQNVRPDSRPLHSLRPTSITPSVLQRNTHGSALVKLGNTTILSAITLQVGRPTASHPHRGELEINLSVTNLSSPHYSPAGKPLVGEGTSCSPAASSCNPPTDPQAVEGWLQRTIEQTACVNPDEWCIAESKSAWKVRVTLVCLNHDGNLQDAAFLAVVAALRDGRLPRVAVCKGDGMVCILEEEEEIGGEEEEKWRIVPSRPFRLACIPISLTVGWFDGTLLADPTSQEEQVLDGLVTVVVANGGVVAVTSVGAAIPIKELASCMQLALGRAVEMEPAIRGLS